MERPGSPAVIPMRVVLPGSRLCDEKHKPPVEAIEGEALAPTVQFLLRPVPGEGAPSSQDRTRP